MEMTQGMGPDRCIDAVGMEAHGSGTMAEILDTVKDAAKLDKQLQHPYVLQQMVKCCRKGGNLSVPGVYTGYLNMFPMGPAMNKGLTWKMGQTHMQKYMPSLLEKIEKGEIDPAAIITHRLTLDEAPMGYEIFQKKQDNCIKVVMTP